LVQRVLRSQGLQSQGLQSQELQSQGLRSQVQVQRLLLQDRRL
jgi:hypothetical protein